VERTLPSVLAPSSTTTGSRFQALTI
jgi:hypothetical protein